MMIFHRDMAKNFIWAQTPKYGNLGPDPPKIKKFKVTFLYQKHRINTLLKSPRPLSDDDFSPRYGQKCIFGPKCLNMVIWA